MEKYDAIYGRQSVDKVDSISIESQIEFCQYETRGGVYKVFQDKGFSGKNTDRPDFQRMMDCIRGGEVSRVIVYKLDRISRSILDFANMMEEFQKFGVEFVSCNEKFDTSTPMGRAMLNICIVFAQLERETIQMRVTDAYLSRSRKGFYMGGPIPMGFKLEPYMLDGKKTSRYVVDPEPAEIIKLIYSMYAQPQTSYGDIVRYMEANGIKNPVSKDGTWGRTQLGDTIKNPIYVQADLELYRFFKNQGTEIHNSPEDFIGTNGCYLYEDKSAGNKARVLNGQHLVLAPHEGIVPSDVWIAARVKCLNNKSVSKPIKAHNTWLAGKIKCGRCGHALVVRKGNKGRVRYLRCVHRIGSYGCVGAGRLFADVVEANVLQRMKEHVNQYDVASQPTGRQQNPIVHELNIKLEQITAEINSLMDKVSSANSVLMEYINKRVSELDAQSKTYRQQLIELSATMSTPRHDMIELAERLDHWEELDYDDRRIVVDELVQKVAVTDQTVDIQWRY